MTAEHDDIGAREWLDSADPIELTTGAGLAKIGVVAAASRSRSALPTLHDPPTPSARVRTNRHCASHRQGLRGTSRPPDPPR